MIPAFVLHKTHNFKKKNKPNVSKKWINENVMWNTDEYLFLPLNLQTASTLHIMSYVYEDIGLKKYRDDPNCVKKLFRSF